MVDRPSQRILSVSGLTRMLQSTLRDKFFSIWVAGEVSNLTQPVSGHVYLTLGDDNAQIKGVLWRSEASRINFDLQNGMQVICRGEIDIYPPRGVYQLIVREIEPKGVGAQLLALKQLQARLQAEGLFDAQRKKPLPFLPSRIAVITSPTGAAIRDFLQVINRRWPDMDVLIIPARVQGQGAAQEIAQGVVVASMLRHRPDVVVVTRGGGSAEDLWSFNDEQVVRAIAACPIPVVSGVGHEIDVTLADLVADVRALTPSEAAELIVPVRQQIDGSLEEISVRMHSGLNRMVIAARQRLHSVESRRAFQDPTSLLHVARRQTDELELRMQDASSRIQKKAEHALALLASRLQSISPLNVLARGYSVTESPDGKLIRQTSQVSTGDRIVTRLANGQLESQILKVDD